MQQLAVWLSENQAPQHPIVVFLINYVDIFAQSPRGWTPSILSLFLARQSGSFLRQFLESGKFQGHFKEDNKTNVCQLLPKCQTVQLYISQVAQIGLKWGYPHIIHFRSF